MKEFRIEGRHAGKRLDRFMEEIEHWPHGMVVKAIRMKKLKVNGKKEDGTYRLCEGGRTPLHGQYRKNNADAYW